MLMRHLLITEDGSHTVESDRWQVTYHSKFGALQEAHTVYVEAGFHHILGKLLGENPKISILEMGFGTGLNAFMTYLRSLHLPGIKIEYTGLEAMPLETYLVNQLNYPEHLGTPDERSTFLQMHQATAGEWQQLSPDFTFRRVEVPFEFVDFGTEQFELLYYDAFAPNAQPELWDYPAMQKAYNLLRMGGVMTTYCAKGDFKRLLKSVGFSIETLPGPKGKREMTRATKAYF